jgi:hypothetical protein
VPASETLTSELLTERPSVGWLAGAAGAGGVVAVASLFASAVAPAAPVAG